MRANAETFNLNYASMDQLVNFCQEKLIPEFSPDLDLRLLRSKYEMLIDRLLTGGRPLEDNDVNIYNFRSLINLLSMLDILPNQQKLNYLARLKDIKNQTQRFGADSHLEFVKTEILKIFFESSDILEINSDDYCLVLSEHIVINAVVFNFDLFTKSRYGSRRLRSKKSPVPSVRPWLRRFLTSLVFQPLSAPWMSFKKNLFTRSMTRC